MPERTLILLRHAKSDWSGDEPDDAGRWPSAASGRHPRPAAGWPANVGPIDLAVVSPAVRARSTWELAVGRARARAARTVVDDRVYAASSGELLDVVRGLDDDHRTVVLVGHNPGLEDLVAPAHRRLGGDGDLRDRGDRPARRLGGRAAGAATLRTSGRPPS